MGGPSFAGGRGHRSTACVDETLADSFPASDPPAWTSGMARIAPSVFSRSTVEHTASIPISRTRPAPGDVLVSEPTARADVYAISVVPAAAQIVAGRYPDAIEIVRDLARERGVDGWYTGDHTHYAQVARYRYRGE